LHVFLNFDTSLIYSPKIVVVLERSSGNLQKYRDEGEQKSTVRLRRQPVPPSMPGNVSANVQRSWLMHSISINGDEVSEAYDVGDS